jgi:hypothetical protein
VFRRQIKKPSGRRIIEAKEIRAQFEDLRKIPDDLPRGGNAFALAVRRRGRTSDLDANFPSPNRKNFPSTTTRSPLRQ